MTEQEPPFDEQAVSEVLGPPATVEDTDIGEGYRYRTAGNRVSIDVFPAAGVTRLRSRRVRVEVAGIPTVDQEQVVLRHLDPAGYKEVAFTADRESVAFVYAPVYEPPPVQHGGETPTRTVPTPPPPVTGDQLALRHAAAEAPPPEAVPESPAARLDSDQVDETQEDEATKLSLTGRLGRSPAFRTTSSGSLVGKFPLAVHREDGQTTWHTVLAFGPRAEQLRRRAESGELAKGREVDVIGYLHVNERPGKDGPRKVQEVYAVAVKKR